MKTRDYVIEYQKTLDDSGTLIKDLDAVEPISALYLEFEAANGATSNKGNFLSDVITKIEITDGGDVEYSVNLSQLEALYFYKTHKLPVLFPSEWAAGTQRHGVYMLFGRYLWDPTYNLALARYTNPQLKITSNLSAIRTADGTGFDTATLKATIVAKLMKEVPAAPTFLAAKETEPFTSAASGEKRVELNRDRIYRLLLLRFWLQGYDVNEIVSDVKLTADMDDYVVFNRKLQQLDAEALAEYGAPGYKHDMLFGHGDSIRVLFNKEPFATPYAQAPGTPRMFNLTAQWSSLLSELEVYAHDGSLDTTDRKVTAWVRGHALHACVPVVFGILNEPNTWFDPRVYKKLELVLTQGTASAACSVVAEQVR